MPRKQAIYILLENGEEITLSKARELFKNGDMEVGLLLRQALKENPGYKPLSKADLQHLKNYSKSKEAREHQARRKKAQEAFELDDLVEDGNTRATPLWIRDLIERYAAGDISVYNSLSNTPFGEVLIQTFNKAAAGDMSAADKVYKMLGVYNVLVKDKSDDNNSKPELFQLPL